MSIEKFKTSLQAGYRSKHTVDAYISDMRYFPDADTMTAAGIYSLVGEWQSEGVAQKTIKRRLSALSAYYNYMITKNKRLTNPALAINAQTQIESLPPKTLTAEQIKKIFTTLHRTREFAMFMLCLQAGLRVSEVVAINLEDINLERGFVIIRKANSGKDRPVILIGITAEAIRRYLPHRHATDPKALFTTAHGRITTSAIQKMFKAHAASVGVNASISALKYSFNALVAENSLDLSFFQELLMHMHCTCID